MLISLKHLSLLLTTSILTISSFGQININYGQPKQLPNDTLSDPETGSWYRLDEVKGGYVYVFNKNPVGVMKALKMIQNILKENGMAYNLYEKDYSLISPKVKDMTDYENLNLTFLNGSSILGRIWTKGNDLLSITFDNKDYYILSRKIQ